MSAFIDGPDYAGLPGTFAGLAHDQAVRDMLAQVVTSSVELITNCVSASITLIERGQATTAAGSERRAFTLDAAQYAADDGPCLHSGRTEVVINVADLDVDPRWRAFSRTALDHGIASSLSAPLIPGGRTRGSINAYGAVLNGFDRDDERILETLAGQASVIVANAHAYWAPFDFTRNLTSALETRSVIDQAKGVLMARHRVNGEEAFAQLCRWASDTDCSIRDAAEAVLAQANAGGADRGDRG